jgi:AraC family transcriptional regulator, arabinose operon regulatory protein
MDPIITPSPPAGLLVTGHFRQGADYRTLRPEGTADWLLIYTLGGRGCFAWAGGVRDVEAGDLILLRPATPHDYRTTPGAQSWELGWAHFISRPEWLDWVNWPELAPGLMHVSLREQPWRERLEQRLHEMIAHNAGPGARRAALAMNALEEVLLRADAANPRRSSAGLDPRVRRVVELMLARLAEPWTVERLAAAVALSPSRFAHLFREQTGETPQRYLELRRLEQARRLLEFTQEPVAAIAQMVGFGNPFYFTRRFKKQLGQGPRAWRENLP